MKLKRTIVAPALVAGVALVSGGWLLQQGVGADESVYRRAQLFEEVMRYVSTRYVEPTPSSELYQKAIEGMLRGLGDPHTVFMTAEDYAQLHLQTTGEYAGVGIRIAPQDGYITAVGVLPNTPAERAGVRVGDRMVQIDGQDAKDWTDERAVRALRGPRGTTVSISVRRLGAEEPITFRLVREEIRVESVPYAYMAAPGVGYVDLSVFASTSTDEIRAAIARLRGEGMHSLILDLRDNPGGLLDQGVQVADLFLPPGATIVETRARDPRESETFRAETPEALLDLPVVVLVNGYSASAAEIVAGALQDHDRALVLGTTSYGKGSVQSLFPLSGGNFLKMTTAKWYTPAGRSIHKDRHEEEESETAEAVEPVDPSGVPVPQDSARRVPYRTDSGRLVYGGGGIVPDLVVRQDTSTLAERDFLRALARDIGKFERVLTDFAVEYGRDHPALSPDFPLTQAMRDQLLQRMQAAGVRVTPEQFRAGQRYLDSRITQQIALLKFNPSVAARRNDVNDRALLEAVRLLQGSRDQASLFRAAAAAASRTGLAAPRSR
jgi:carboxyl-terminal processing protease